jgi:hypothetical protein
MQVGFLLALAGVPVREFFDNVDIGREQGSSMLINRLREQQRVIMEKQLNVIQVLF